MNAGAYVFVFQISLNYKQDYQIGSTLLIPERMYFADISGLPKNFNEGVDPQGCCGKSVTMPGGCLSVDSLRKFTLLY